MYSWGGALGTAGEEKKGKKRHSELYDDTHSRQNVHSAAQSVVTPTMSTTNLRSLNLWECATIFS